MIEHQTIDGREAAVAYLDDDFNPVDAGTPGCLVKIVFEDGEMVLLRAPGSEAPPANDEAPEEHEHDAEPFDRHRARFAPKRLKIHGHSLATWASNIIAHEGALMKTAISVGLTSGLDNTDIAHRVIGSRRNNGAEGVTEITRQHLYRLGRGLLHKRKTRMRGAVPDVQGS